MNPTPPLGPGTALASGVLALLLGLPGAGCGHPEEGSIPQDRVPVAVATARVGGAEEGWSEVPGTVEAAQAATIASRFAAVVESVPVEEGSAVRAGDLLVRLDGRDLRARLEAAEAAFRMARAQRDRVRRLFEKQAATPQELEAAEAADTSGQAERDAARAQLEYVDLRAPFAGRVTEKEVRQGDLALPGQPLLTLQGSRRLRVAASVSRSQADRLRPGNEVEAVLEDGGVVRTRLSVLSPAGDPASRRILVKSDLPEGTQARAGSFARLRLPRGDEEALPVVPARALFERGALTGVYVVQDDRARLRWISPGGLAGDSILVRSGLRADEEVVLDPPAGLRDGDPVSRAGAAGVVRP
jgi:RND family efflux transporter MFP subunit